MNVLPRQDRLLLAGFALAVPVVVYARPIEQWLINLARETETRSGLALVPALLVLTVAFIVNQQHKRFEAKTRASTAEAAATLAHARASDMERLVTFGQALARSLDLDSIRDVVRRQLPNLAGSDKAWIHLRAPQELAPEPDTAGHLCVPLTAGGYTVGVLGVPESAGPFTEERQRLFATVAAMLAIAVRNAQLFQEVRENSVRDQLTGCFNRAHALDVIDTELRRARRSQLPVSLIMFDLDFFKDINDRYGHLCGDAVLAAVGGRMRDVLRGSDLKCRYGGEEFLVLLPETPLEGAKRVADTLRREIAEMAVNWKDERLRVTASFGVTVAMPSEIDAKAIISRADAALYRAKDQGRNCVRLSLETVVV